MFIQALAESVLAYQAQHGKPEKLLMSFHGIPQPYADKGDPYADRCRITAKLVAGSFAFKKMMNGLLVSNHVLENKNG